MLGGNRQWIPLKLNALGYADHFAQAIMFIPAALAGLSKSDTSQSIVGSNMFGFWYNFILRFNNCIYFLLYCNYGSY
jgi:preprotein translocase subunit SecY